jgi:hypothetical protein
MGNGMGDLLIHVTHSNQGCPIESSHCKIALKITKTLSIKLVISLFYSLSLVALSHILCLSPKNTPKVLLHYYIPYLISDFMLSCYGWGGGHFSL